jgi:hypothetical protein
MHRFDAAVASVPPLEKRSCISKKEKKKNDHVPTTELGRDVADRPMVCE